MHRYLSLSCLLLAACGGEGDWLVETWGEDYIEDTLPAEIFADGCSVTYDAFVVSFTGITLLDGEGEAMGEVPAQVLDLTEPGPVQLGAVTVAADHYSSVRVVVGPAPDSGEAVRAEGTVACGGQSAHFAWAFDVETIYDCEPPDLTIPGGGSDTTQLTIHGDHLFYDGLVNADAEVRGQAILDADADADGEITPEELRAVSIPALGYEVGEYSDVLDLYAFVEHLSRTIGHIDGEGECLVDF
jgi:hypothetical protein